MPTNTPTEMPTRAIDAVAVFCGSNFGASDQYSQDARKLGLALARTGIKVVYGGTTKGLMGAVADAAISAGGQVHGVITESLHRRGHSHSTLTHCEVATTLRKRKERMVELADAFIALPGGIGTIEEMMEVWTMNQLLEIDKPLGLLNTAGFFTPFMAFIAHMIEQRFLPSAHLDSIAIHDDASVLIDLLRRQPGINVPKWL